MIPKEQSSGIILSCRKILSKPARDLDARQQIPIQDEDQGEVLFTLEPEKSENGHWAVLLCGWIHGNPSFEMDPFNVLCGLVGERNLARISTSDGTFNHTSSLTSTNTSLPTPR